MTRERADRSSSRRTQGVGRQLDVFNGERPSSPRAKVLPIKCRLGKKFSLNNHELVADFEITLRADNQSLTEAFEDMLAEYVNAHARRRRRWEARNTYVVNAIRYSHGLN